MKKTLIALAVLAASGASFAQATVSGKRIRDDYLGVRFIEGPEDYIVGQPGQFRFQSGS